LHEVAADLGGGADGQPGEFVGVDLPGAGLDLLEEEAAIEAEPADGIDRDGREGAGIGHLFSPVNMFTA